MEPQPTANLISALRAVRRIGRAALVALAAAALVPGVARAGRVSGVLLTYQGQPDPSRDLHFENCVTRDIFLAPTHSDGSFAQTLPPGCYNLRAERGAILRSGIRVDDAAVPLGQVSELAPLAPARLFDLQAIFPSLLTSPAPSTAYIYTRDTTVVPASAPKVAAPSSESAWVRSQKESGMDVGAKSLAPSARPWPNNPPAAGAPAAPDASYNPPASFGPQGPAGAPPQP